MSFQANETVLCCCGRFNMPVATISRLRGH